MIKVTARLKTILPGLFFVVIFFWLPFIFVYSAAKPSIIYGREDLVQSDAAIIFGAHLNESGEPTELLKERLDAGRYLYENGIVRHLIVSNTAPAAQVMATYLLERGIPEDVIELDAAAVTTPDSCRSERKQHPEGRTVLFLSQGYHLPRLLYQCKKVGVEGVGIAVESLDVIDKSNISLISKFTIRTSRYIREAALIWLVMVNVY